MKKLLLITLFLFIYSCGKKSEVSNTESVVDLDIKATKVEVENPLSAYTQLGVGGGGAMTSLSFSPYTNVWLVGTDMGTLFRSIDNGDSWTPIDKKFFTLTSDLSLTTKPMFFPDAKTILFSPDSKRIFRSSDNGDSWENTNINLDDNERVIYFRSISNSNDKALLATNKALYLTIDNGLSWSVIHQTNYNPNGTFIDYTETGIVIYHSFDKFIVVSKDLGKTWIPFYTSSQSIFNFTGGRSKGKLILAFSDRDGINACTDIDKFKAEVGAESITKHKLKCGFLWVSNGSNNFIKSKQIVGDHLYMSENDPETIYVTGSTDWIRQYGTKIWKSTNSGESFELVLHQYNWDTGVFTPWDEKKLERSAIALDVGWDDSGYVSFDVNLRDSSILGGTGFYFLFTSNNKGKTWSAPFTKYSDIGKPTEKKKWSSNGLEVTSVYKIKAHPRNQNIIYAAMADISAIKSANHGSSWTIAKAKTNSQNNYNSIYDFAFTDNQNEVLASASDHHDFPNDGWTTPNTGSGGVLYSNDQGKTWIELTKAPFNHQYLSIAYNKSNNTIYAGTQGKGVVASKDMGKTWAYFNLGLPSSDKIIPQIEIDPTNFDVYLLLTGNIYYNQNDYNNFNQTGIYKLNKTTNKWELLRGTIVRPNEISKTDSFKPWLFPTCFAVDFYSKDKTLYLGDNEKDGRYLHSGIWKSSDTGKTWKRATQYTHPRSIIINKNSPNEVFVSGLRIVDGTWGIGGLLNSNDKGETWSRNDEVPHKTNATFTMLDEHDSSKIFYGFHGSAILHGPKPNN